MVVWIKCDVLYYGGSLGNMVVVEGTIATYTKHLGTWAILTKLNSFV